MVLPMLTPLCAGADIDGVRLRRASKLCLLVMIGVRRPASGPSASARRDCGIRMTPAGPERRRAGPTG